jgi:RNA polymerase sigma factor (sigma-70 family)
LFPEDEKMTAYPEMRAFFLDKHVEYCKDIKDIGKGEAYNVNRRYQNINRKHEDHEKMKRTESSMTATLLLSPAKDLYLAEEVNLDKTLFSEENVVCVPYATGDGSYKVHEQQPSEADLYTAMSDTLWSALYPSLHSLACYLVRTSPLPCWRGQEDDIADDIAQETVRRVIERDQKAKRGEAPPIQSFKQTANTVAYNYYRDLKRHDYRVSRLDTTNTTDASAYASHFDPVDVSSDEYVLDTVADKVDQESLFARLADEIGRFPTRQKQAILIDMANRMYFDTEPTSLQKSFREVGIELRDYCQALPDDQKERSRHISLCSQAYKRVAHLSCQYAYASGEQISGFVTDHASTSDTGERIETNMMPFVRSPDQSIQVEDIADTPTQINGNEDVVMQSPNPIFGISTLTEPYKTSLHMRIVEKKTYQEIANYMCLPIGTVKSHISRGMKILRKRMDTNEVDEQTMKRDTEDALLSIEDALACKQIPQPYRTVLHLHYIEKLTYATIASRLQMPIGTVKSYINRGKKFLGSNVAL